jgi:hypothetical protein
MMPTVLPLFDLANAGRARSRRESSYDRTGGNVDFAAVPAGGRLVLLDADGPGMVTHLWFALGSMDYNYLRNVSLKAWWDGHPEPSIDCPLGDFFGVGHAVANKYECLLMNMVRGSGQRGEFTGMNCHLPMPFTGHARLEVVNDNPNAFLICYYQVDWLQTGSAPGEAAGYLHASWRRENPTARMPVPETGSGWYYGRFSHTLNDQNNFLVADVRGEGRFLGINLSIDNIDPQVAGMRLGGFGEGDEMIFIDDEAWPPSFHGTGTEDYFSEAWGMAGQCGLYAGASLPDQTMGGKGFRGTCYRFHYWDPIYFKKALRFSFEHGHANCQANDLAATAYWYQRQVSGVPALPAIGGRRPVRAASEPSHADEDRAVALLAEVAQGNYDLFLNGRNEQVVAIGLGTAAETLTVVNQAREQFLAGAITVAEVAERLRPCRQALAAIR